MQLFLVIQLFNHSCQQTHQRIKLTNASLLITLRSTALLRTSFGSFPKHITNLNITHRFLSVFSDVESAVEIFVESGPDHHDDVSIIPAGILSYSTFITLSTCLCISCQKAASESPFQIACNLKTKCRPSNCSHLKL